MPWFRQIWAIKDTLILVFTPLVLLPLLICFPGSPSAACAYTIIIMAIYWMTEVLNMAVTALIPVVLFPWLGVMSSKQVCTNYLKDANMLFFGGLLVAIAVEKWNLHKRVALRVLMLVGSKPLWIVFGFMAVTAFLSMWLNNTATTAMMMPIAQAVLKELDENRKKQLDLQQVVVDNGKPATSVIVSEVIELKEFRKLEDGVRVNGSNGTTPAEDEQLENTEAAAAVETDPLHGAISSADRVASDRQFLSFRKALKLCIPYASSIGGTGTLIGSGPNIVLKGQLEAMYKGVETGINFTSWLVIGFPAMVIDLIGAWIILLLIFLGPKETFGCGGKGKKQDDSANQVIRAEYAKLGRITFAEVVVLVNFIILAFLWLSREPEFIPGWGDQLPHNFVTDASVAITISVLLFIFPSEFPNYLCFRRKAASRPPGPAPAILDWPTANKQMPWSVIILLGGGFALADACKESGLSAVIGEALSSFRYLPPWAIVTIMCLIATVITSFTSNMATTTIFIPILAEMAATTCINPIYLMLPVTLAASWAFILPVSTPPNAIAHSYGDLAISDMMKAGLAMCALCNAVLLFSINTWGYSFFNLGEFPAWATGGKPSNCTTTLINETMSALGYTTDSGLSTLGYTTGSGLSTLGYTTGSGLSTLGYTTGSGFLNVTA